MPWVVLCASRLTERDRQVALDCYDHYVLTTGQLQRLHFPSVREPGSPSRSIRATGSAPKLDGGGEPEE
jgi:hypothetical protein